MNKANLLKRIILCVLSVIVLLGVISVPCFAEEAPVDAKQVVALIEKLPVNSELVTIEHKDDILAAKTAYNGLTVEQRLDVPTNKSAILNADYAAIIPFLMADLVTGIKALPEAKKLSDKDTETVLALYNDYGLLDDDAKAAFSQEHKDTLFAAVNKLAPDKLAEGDAPAGDDATQEGEEEKEETKQKIDFNKVWQIALMVTASLIVLLTLAAIIVLIVKMVAIRRKVQGE